MHNVSYGDNLYEMPKPIFLEKIEIYSKVSSAEIRTHNAKR